MSIHKLNVAIGIVLYLLMSQSLFAHEVRPAHLKLNQISEARWQAVFRQPQVGGRFLNLRLSTNCVQTETKVTNSNSALKQTLELNCEDAGLQVIKILGLSGTLVDTLVSMEDLAGNEKNLLISPRHPEVNLVEAEVSVPAYLKLGFEHLWLGIDHILFLLVLMYLVKGWKNLLKVVTSFTVAHSLTLGIAATGIINVSQGPVEALIALSIIVLALEALREKQSLVQRYPWLVTFVFGLLHGLGFAGALADIGLPEGHMFAALLLFNIGIELGQLSILLAALLLVRLVGILRPDWPNWVGVMPLYLAGGMAMWWFVERSYGVLLA